MAHYYVNKNKQPTGEHEVHTTGCPHPPDAPNRHSLGDHPNCASAVRAAKAHYTTVDGCYWCTSECHKR